jgi:hypothetical protein
MSEEKEDIVEEDPFSPPMEKQMKTSTDDLILTIIKELKISYPNEIASHTGFTQQTVLARLAFMRVHGLVERVNIGKHPPEDLKARLPQLWEVGLKGAQIRRCAWHRVKEDGESKKE